MKKSNITGWKDVYSFSLIQTFKSKAFIISFLITLVLSLVSMPLLSFLNGGDNTADNSSLVKKVYINNKSTLTGMDFKELRNKDQFSHITFEVIEGSYDEIASRIEESETESIILTIAEDEAQVSLTFTKASESILEESDLSPLADEITKQFQIYRNAALGISDEQLGMLNAKVDTLVTMSDVNGEEIVDEDTSISGIEYAFIYVLIFILMMIINTSSTQIAHAIVTEKSTRVIEYLLTSIRPLAIIVGKILAALTSILLQIVSMLALVFISNKLVSSAGLGNGKDILSQYLPENMFANLSVFNIVLCLVIIILGFIFYATLAGLVGATVSKIEEINEGLKLFIFLIVIGVYIALAAAIVLSEAGENDFITFSLLFPLSSPFILPGAIMIGKTSFPIVIISMALLIIFIILLFKFVAKVYETLILHNGNAIKFKELFKISKTV